MLLGNQVPETIALARAALAHGAFAACSFGAGFGGSVWALVEGDGRRVRPPLGRGRLRRPAGTAGDVAAVEAASSFQLSIRWWRCERIRTAG